jgi:hypothetical protein
MVGAIRRAARGAGYDFALRAALAKNQRRIEEGILGKCQCQCQCQCQAQGASQQVHERPHLHGRKAGISRPRGHKTFPPHLRTILIENNEALRWSTCRTSTLRP